MLYLKQKMPNKEMNIEKIIKSSETLFKIFRMMSGLKKRELLQALVLVLDDQNDSNDQKTHFEDLGEPITGFEHHIPAEDIEKLISRYSPAFLVHTHLGSNIPPSSDDISVMFICNFNHRRNISHLIVDERFVWYYKALKDVSLPDAAKTAKKIEEISKKYDSARTQYLADGNITEFSQVSQTLGFSLHRFEMI